MAIPTRFDIGQGAAGTALFNQLLQGSMGAGARPSAYITGGLPTARRGTPLPIVRKRPPMPEIGLRGIRDISALPAGGGMTSLQRDLAARMGLGAPRPTPATARASIGDKIAGILPAAGTPEAAGLGAAGARMLQLSGYSDRPISTSQILGEAAQSYMKEAKEARAAQAAAELAKQQRETDIALKMMEIRATQAATERETSKIITDREMKRSEQFRTASKPFGEARLNYERVVANATTKNPTGATDIALIFNFMKMLDPTSVVRESEFQAAAGASPLLLRLGAEYNKLFRKEAEKLPEATRRQFFQAATETYVPYVEGQQRLEQDFISEAERFNLNPENVVRTKVPKRGTKEYPYIVYDVGEAENLPDGTWVMLNGELLQVSR